MEVVKKQRGKTIPPQKKKKKQERGDITIKFYDKEKMER